MRSDRERDAEMDRLLRAVLADEPTTGAGACPPADELAAYAERTLTDGEREGMDTHLAACRQCQEALALLATMPESSAPGLAVSPSPAWWRAGWKRWLVPLAAAATAVVLYVAISPDATLRPAAPSRESVVTSAPAQLPASPLPAVAEPAESGKAGAAVGRQQQSAPAAPRVDQPSRLVETQGRKDLSGGERQASKAKPMRVEALPAPVVPPEMSRDVAAPVATFVGAHAPLSPPPPPPPPAASKAEAKEQLAHALPVVGGVVAGDAGRRQAGEAPPKVPKPLTETVIVTAATPLVQARASVALPVVVSAKDDPDVRWRFGPGTKVESSADAGRSWRLQYSGTGDVLAGSSPSRTTCWAVGAAGLVLRTTDGQAWEARPFPERVDLVAVTATDATHATVTARDGRQFSTEDGGATWTPAR